MKAKVTYKDLQRASYKTDGYAPKLRKRLDNAVNQERYKLGDFGPRRKLVMATAKRHHLAEAEAETQGSKSGQSQLTRHRRYFAGPLAESCREESPGAEYPRHDQEMMMKSVYVGVRMGMDVSGVRLKDHPLAKDPETLRAKLERLRGTYRNPDAPESMASMSRIIGICPKDLERIGWGRK